MKPILRFCLVGTVSIVRKQMNLLYFDIMIDSIKNAIEIQCDLFIFGDKHVNPVLFLTISIKNYVEIDLFIVATSKSN